MELNKQDLLASNNYIVWLKNDDGIPVFIANADDLIKIHNAMNIGVRSICFNQQPPHSINPNKEEINIAILINVEEFRSIEYNYAYGLENED